MAAGAAEQGPRPPGPGPARQCPAAALGLMGPSASRLAASQLAVTLCCRVTANSMSFHSQKQLDLCGKHIIGLPWEDPTPPQPYSLSQSTRLNSLGYIPASHWNYFSYSNVCVSVLLTQSVSPSPSLTMSTSFFSISVSLLLPANKFIRTICF